MVGTRGSAGRHNAGLVGHRHGNGAAQGAAARSGGATGSVWEGKGLRGGVGHMGWSGSRRHSRPGEAARAVKSFETGANENIEALF
jgi:hypothetical protein